MYARTLLNLSFWPPCAQFPFHFRRKLVQRDSFHVVSRLPLASGISYIQRTHKCYLWPERNWNMYYPLCELWLWLISWHVLAQRWDSVRMIASFSCENSWEIINQTKFTHPCTCINTTIQRRDRLCGVRCIHRSPCMQTFGSCWIFWWDSRW